jgi:hypothetical protein
MLDSIHDIADALAIGAFVAFIFVIAVAVGG